MGKIGIISQLSRETLNYGNRLQAFALNSYLSNKCRFSVISLMVPFYKRKLVVSGEAFLHILLNKVYKKILTKIQLIKNKNVFFERLKNAQKFTSKSTAEVINTFQDLQKMNYDILITGSDVVWAQGSIGVDRVRFLDFSLPSEYKKVSYAASFGKNLIPSQNIKYVKKYLDDFDAISVREKSSIELLKSIGVENVVHTCDPTLLLTAEEWGSVAEPVQEIKEKYIFVYLLGKDANQREAIKKLAEKYNLKIATIPHADNVYDPVDDDFGDYKLMDASPENWVWLIKNAEYVITDSFHGTVFSTIFSKKFIVIKRCLEEDINIRMTDYLDTIGEQDKFVDILTVDSLDGFVWDYEKIHSLTDDFIEKSKKYLEKALN